MGKVVLLCNGNQCFEHKIRKYQNFSMENYHFSQIKKITVYCMDMFLYCNDNNNNDVFIFRGLYAHRQKFSQ